MVQVTLAAMAASRSYGDLASIKKRVRAGNCVLPHLFR